MSLHWAEQRASINAWKNRTPFFYTPSPDALVSAALAYAKAGRPVFPVKHIRPDGVCSCGADPCGKATAIAPHGEGAGKHPDTLNGFKDATTDENKIRAWWRRQPRAHIGLWVLPGELVIDVDDRAGGNDSFKNVMQVQYPLFPDTPHAFTGGKGHHYFFTLPKEALGTIPASGDVVGFKGIEWKADGGGYVVVAPSGHYTGGEYRWEEETSLFDIPIAPIPEWLLALVLKSSGRSKPSAQGQTTKQTQGASWAWDKVVAFFQRTYPEGTRRVATGLPRLVGILASKGHVPEEIAIDFLLDWQQTHFAPPLAAATVTAQIQTMYARWRPATDPVRGTIFLRRLIAGIAALPSDVPTSRTPPYIRDVGTFVEQDVSEDLEHAAPAPSVAQQAAALAGNYRDAAIRGFPQDPGGFVKGGSKAVRRKDDHKHLAIHSGSSDTWQEPNNAALKRRKIYQFYSPLLWDIVERLNMGAVYQFRYHLSSETIKEDAKYNSNLHSRIRRHHGNYVDFLVLEEDGWWVHTFSDYADNFGNTEPIVAVQEDFLGWLQGLGPPGAEYRRRYPVMASEAWKMPKSRTHEWESLGSRSTPDILHYKDIEDREDAEAAAQRGIATWLATEQEIMGRAPEDILYTRHFQGGEAHSARFMLSFLKNDLGFFLYPKAMAELEAPEPNSAPWDYQGVAPPAPQQAHLVV